MDTGLIKKICLAIIEVCNKEEKEPSVDWDDKQVGETPEAPKKNDEPIIDDLLDTL